MNELERDLAARLHGLADDYTAPSHGVRPEAAVARYRQVRRTRRMVTVVAAVVAAVVVGVPTAVGQLSSAPDPGDVARPDRSSTAPATSVPPLPDHPLTADRAGAGATGGAEAYGKDPAPDVPPAERDRLTAEATADLAAVAGLLPSSLQLSSPAEWDRWLPEGKPYPGVDTADDMSTCPRLAAGLESALGAEVSYWTGTLPNGPGGCTWAPTPLQYETTDYPFVVTVGFLADGTTPQDHARRAFDWVPQGDPTPCPHTDAAGGVLIRCASGEQAGFALVVPDLRGAGTWVLAVNADRQGAVTAGEALLALVDGVTRAYG